MDAFVIFKLICIALMLGVVVALLMGSGGGDPNHPDRPDHGGFH